MLVAMAVDAVLGWPGALFARIGHPVTWLGGLIGALDARWNRPADTPDQSAPPNYGLLDVVMPAMR